MRGKDTDVKVGDWNKSLNKISTSTFQENKTKQTHRQVKYIYSNVVAG
jgi:hypothetical protein